MSLINLPLELQRMVLAQITDPRDFKSMVLSCKSLYNAYQAYPEQLLIGILNKTITSDALPDAIALADFLYREKITPRGNLAKLMGMWRLQMTISDHVLNYSNWALDEIKRNANANNAVVAATANSAASTSVAAPATGQDENKVVAFRGLSPAERSRFERAFYRFELYCRAVPARWFPDNTNGDLGAFLAERKAETAFKRYGLFCSAWQPWEMAEMLGVHEFYSRKIREKMFRLNQKLEKAVLAAPGVQLPPAQPEADADPAPGMIAMRNFRGYGLGMYGEGSYNSGYGMSIPHDEAGRPDIRLAAKLKREEASQLASKGAAFVAKLMTSDHRSIKKLANVHRLEWRTIPYEFYERCLTWPRNHPQGVPRPTIWVGKIILPEHEGIGRGEDGQRCGTFGFRTHYLDVFDGISRGGSTVNKRLGMMATPFWDASRMQNSVFVDAFKNINSPVYTARDKTDIHISSWTAERSLKGVAIPEKEFRRIQKEFGHVRRVPAATVEHGDHPSATM